MDKRPIRAEFSKTDRAVYISHLDLLRTMQRALKRAMLPVWYSEGYNPRAYLNFPLPLSLGVESGCEYMDLYVIDDISCEEFCDRLNAVLPVGLHIIRAYPPVNKNTDITEAHYRIWLKCDDTADTSALTAEFLSLERIETEKRSKKKGIVTLDIKPFIKICGQNMLDDGTEELMVMLPAGNDMNINAVALTGAFESFCASKGIAVGYIRIQRTGIYCADGKAFE
ncbi:MAG: DUF2344 domain-containing protein [Oscillospiraceae bacterium]|nr:DUF2344 domain-containing protein [Oscillospiraceae bacterium]